MSIVFTLDDYMDLLNDTYYTNDTHILNPETSPCPINSHPAVDLTLSLILIAIFLLAIPGNLLVGWVIGTSRQRLTPSDVYLFHLTIADGLMALTLPFWAVALVQGWSFGAFMCKFLSLIIDANFYTSILFLSFISIDRYLVIVHASESLRRGQRKCSWLLCAALWAIGWALALPALYRDVLVSRSDPQRMTCRENFNVSSASTSMFATRVFTHFFGYFLPLCVMITCYSVTVARLLHTRGFQKHRAMKVIVVVVIAFLLCWTPYHITMMVDTALRAHLIQSDCAVISSVGMALVVTNSLALLHSCINPVLYAFVAMKFRRKMMLLLQKRVRQEWMSGSRGGFSRSTSQSSEGNGTVL